MYYVLLLHYLEWSHYFSNLVSHLSVIVPELVAQNVEGLKHSLT